MTGRRRGPARRPSLSGASQKLRDNIAMLVGMGLFVILNYIGQRFFDFWKTKTVDTDRKKE